MTAEFSQPVSTSVPMDEKRAREIVETYLKTREVVFSARKATEAGPDILIEGKAIEVKGSNFQEKDAFIQLARYVADYASLTFAFPLETLTLSLLYGLLCIEQMVKYVKLGKSQIKVMLLLDVGEDCYLKEFESLEALANEVADAFTDRQLSYGTTPEDIKDKLRNLLGDIEDTIRQLLKDRILRYPMAYSVSQR